MITLLFLYFRFWVFLDGCNENSSVPENVGGLSLNMYIRTFFLAYFHPESREIIILVCCPYHLRKDVLMELKGNPDITSTPSEGSSSKPMRPWVDQAFVFVSGGVCPHDPKDLGNLFLV